MSDRSLIQLKLIEPTPITGHTGGTYNEVVVSILVGLFILYKVHSMNSHTGEGGREREEREGREEGEWEGGHVTLFQIGRGSRICS